MLQAALNKCVRLRLDLIFHSPIDANYFRKINWLPVSEKVEFLLFLNIGTGLYHQILIKYLCLHTILDHKWHHISTKNKCMAISSVFSWTKYGLKQVTVLRVEKPRLLLYML